MTKAQFIYLYPLLRNLWKARTALGIAWAKAELKSAKRCIGVK